jgi:hypothetical protein
MKKTAFFLIASIGLLASCDVIEDPIIPVTTNYDEATYGPPPSFGAPEDLSRNVLLEDFTAHQCGNCPAAAIVAEALEDTYGQDICVVAIHSGSLAATNEEGAFTTDWTNEISDIYYNQLDFQANPLGRVNRSPSLGTFLFPVEWEPLVEDIIAENAEVALQIATNYSDQNNEVNIHVNGQFQEGYPGNLKLAVLVLESHIIDYQLDYSSDPEVIPDYEFNHVLRDAVTGPFGLDFSNNAQDGDEVQKNYTYEWNNAWQVENSSIVAFVYDNETGQVINTVKTYITQ